MPVKILNSPNTNETQNFSMGTRDQCKIHGKRCMKKIALMLSVVKMGDMVLKVLSEQLTQWYYSFCMCVNSNKIP